MDVMKQTAVIHRGEVIFQRTIGTTKKAQNVFLLEVALENKTIQFAVENTKEKEPL